MKLTPQSMALWSAASDSESSTGPHALPMAHAPKLIPETFQGVRPNDRYFISCGLTPGSNFQRGGAEMRRTDVAGSTNATSYDSAFRRRGWAYKSVTVEAVPQVR